jgi:hypothetical protein
LDSVWLVISRFGLCCLFHFDTGVPRDLWFILFAIDSFVLDDLYMPKFEETCIGF